MSKFKTFLKDRLLHEIKESIPVFGQKYFAKHNIVNGVKSGELDSKSKYVHRKQIIVSIILIGLAYLESTGKINMIQYDAILELFNAFVPTE